MSDLATKLEPRQEAVAELLSNIPIDTLWMWSSYKRREGLKVGTFKDSGGTIGYRRNNDKQALLLLTNIRPLTTLQDRKSVDIPTGPPKVIDNALIPIHNFNGMTKIPVSYDDHLTKLVAKERAFAFGFAQSVELAFGFQQGSNTAQNKYNQEIKLGFEVRQNKTDTKGSAGAGSNPVCPPGYDIEFPLERTSQKMRTRVTGKGDMDFGLKAGKHWNGDWCGHRGKDGKSWPRWVSWASYWEEFMPVARGKGRRGLCLAEYFWHNPIDEKLLARLEAPLGLDFDHTGADFDGATILTVGRNVLRGPKHENQRVID